jgi:hypothetical protein
VKSILSRRPSPALVIACAALFLSLGGVSYGVATGFIDSRELKNNTIRSKDVRNNTLRTFDIRNNEVRGFDIRNSSVQGRDVAFDTLTGSDVSEEDLGKVPTAATADTATSAGNAGTVNGMSVRKVFVKQPNATAPVEVFRGEGFVLEAGCQGGDPVLQLDGIAGAPATNATVAGNGETTTVFFGDGSLAPGDDLNLLGGANTEAGGTAIVSTTGGAVATIAYGAESTNAFPGEEVCATRASVVSG